jgi:hypothetical protein
MVCFQTKNPNLGKFWRVLLWKILVHLMTLLSILRPLEIFYGHLVYFVVIWYIFPRFGILDQQKSGNPGPDPRYVVRGPSSGEELIPCASAMLMPLVMPWHGRPAQVLQTFESGTCKC